MNNGQRDHKRVAYLRLSRGLGLACAIFIADQLSKWFVFEHFLRIAAQPAGLLDWLMQAQRAEVYEAMRGVHFNDVALLPFLNVVMVWNRGVSFGLFNNMQDMGPVILTAFALLVALALSVWMYRGANALVLCALGFVVGGAVGNAFDRMRFGAVADFADVHVAGFHWPAFNVADSAIVIGALLLIVDSFRGKAPSADLQKETKV